MIHSFEGHGSFDVNERTACTHRTGNRVYASMRHFTAGNGQWLLSRWVVSPCLWNDTFSLLTRTSRCVWKDSFTMSLKSRCLPVLQNVPMGYSVWQCVAVCFNMLQCVAVCCSVLQCVAASRWCWNGSFIWGLISSCPSYEWVVSRCLRTDWLIWGIWHMTSRHVLVICMCDMSDLHVWHNSFIHMTWLIHKNKTSRIYICKFTCMMWHTHTRNRTVWSYLCPTLSQTDSFMRHDSFICATEIIYTTYRTLLQRDVFKCAHSHVWHDKFIGSCGFLQ